MRIVYLSGTAQLGGAERCLLDVMQSVHADEPAWTLMLIAPRDGPLVERARALGFVAEVVRIPDSVARLGDSATGGHPFRLLAVAVRAVGAAGGVGRYRRRLRRELERLRPDVVHTNGYKMHVMGAWSRPRSAALLWHLHDYVSSRPMMARAMRRFSRDCDAAVAVSPSVARDVAPYWRGRSPVDVVLNAVDLEVFRPEGLQADLDALAGLPPAPPRTVRVGLVATLGRFKGHDVFLRAISRLPLELPLRAYVVGGSLYETRGSEFSLDALRQMSRELGIEERMGFTGFVSEPATAMRALDVIVHATTVPEPFGLVIAEGMACGRAVIASAAGGAAEIVDAEVDALTHAPGDAGGLAAAIERVVVDGALRSRLGAAGRRSAELRFNRDRLGTAMVPIYRTAVASAGKERRPA
ncbi:MAG: glycosyltransferase family 4 protein [Gemmatimonadaceae bacterium]